MNEDPQHAALFTTGNGYMGIRGSYEEFGSARVQGAYVRGLFDEIVEVMEPFPDNEYMKKYYFDEQQLKDFEKQDSCINFAEILLVRFILGKAPYWNGKDISMFQGRCLSAALHGKTRTGMLRNLLSNVLLRMQMSICM